MLLEGIQIVFLLQLWIHILRLDKKLDLIIVSTYFYFFTLELESPFAFDSKQPILISSVVIIKLEINK